MVNLSTVVLDEISTIHVDELNNIRDQIRSASFKMISLDIELKQVALSEEAKKIIRDTITYNGHLMEILLSWMPRVTEIEEGNK